MNAAEDYAPGARSPRRRSAGSTSRPRALVPPLHVTTTFLRDPDNAYRSGNVYGRADNETVREAEAVIGALEGADVDLRVRLGHVGGDCAVPLAAASGAHSSRRA